MKPEAINSLLSLTLPFLFVHKIAGTQQSNAARERISCHKSYGKHNNLAVIIDLNNFTLDQSIKIAVKSPLTHSPLHKFSQITRRFK